MKEEEGNGGDFGGQRVVEHPQLFYRIDETYSIRKDSINNSNDQIYKRLSRQFQRIKKIKAEPNAAALLTAEYDYESCPMRRELKHMHELYNTSSKSHLIVKKRIEKMRHRVDRIKNEAERDEYSSIKEIDPFKLLSKNQQAPPAANPANPNPNPAPKHKP
jgi:hypothetical protein